MNEEILLLSSSPLPPSSSSSSSSLLNGSFIFLMIFETFSSHMHLTEVWFFLDSSPAHKEEEGEEEVICITTISLRSGTRKERRSDRDRDREWGELQLRTNKSLDDSYTDKPLLRRFLLFLVRRHNTSWNYFTQRCWWCLSSIAIHLDTSQSTKRSSFSGVCWHSTLTWSVKYPEKKFIRDSTMQSYLLCHVTSVDYRWSM